LNIFFPYKIGQIIEKKRTS